MVELKPVLFIAGGVAMLVFCVWCYLGRSRAARWWSWWEGGLFTSRREQMIIQVMPGCSVAVVLGGVSMLSDDIERFGNAFAIVFIIAMFWAWWGILGIPVPRGVLPRWYREMKPPKQKRQKKEKKQERDPFDLWDEP